MRSCDNCYFADRCGHITHNMREDGLPSTCPGHEYDERVVVTNENGIRDILEKMCEEELDYHAIVDEVKERVNYQTIIDFLFKKTKKFLEGEGYY